MKYKYAYVIFLFPIIFSCQNPSQNDIAESIAVMIQKSEGDSSLSVLYAQNDFKPFWVRSQSLKKQGEDFFSELDKLKFDGLEQEDYNTEEQYRLLNQIGNTKDPYVHASLDIALSKSFLKMASDLNVGKIDPSITNIEWKMDRKSPTLDYGQLLQTISEGGSIEKIIGQLRPENIRYRELRDLLEALLVKPGEEGAMMDKFEVEIDQADLITKIKVNLERLRWLQDFTDPGRDKIVVNIPDYHLYYIQKEDTVLTSKVVVGKEYRQTPVFKAEMEYLVFHPSWTLPETILWEDVIPSIQNSVQYLKENNMKVLDYQENEVDYRKIKWDKLGGKNDFPYLIRQSPGTENPLGKVKFMFPNEYSIYIHDSPAKNLFSQEERTFSSGCIRMEDAQQLASLLLDGVDDWDSIKINETMEDKEELKIDLEKELDVWILYLTVWGNKENLQVREDVYGMDKKIARALGFPLSDKFL